MIPLLGHATALEFVARMSMSTQMLTDRLGLPASVSSLFVGFTERCDGKGDSGGVGVTR